MDPIEHLLSDVEAFLEAHGMAKTTFGVLAVNDGKIFGRMKARKNMTTSTMCKLRAFMSAYQGDEIIDGKHSVPGLRAGVPDNGHVPD
jgi:hypothetical protein